LPIRRKKDSAAKGPGAKRLKGFMQKSLRQKGFEKIEAVFRKDMPRFFLISVSAGRSLGLVFFPRAFFGFPLLKSPPKKIHARQSMEARKGPKMLGIAQDLDLAGFPNAKV
jgi:hypothetical protein